MFGKIGVYWDGNIEVVSNVKKKKKNIKIALLEKEMGEFFLQALIKKS